MRSSVLFCRLAVCLMVLMLISPGASAFLTRQEALEQVYEIILERLAVPGSGLETNMEHFDDRDGYWTFIFQEKTHPETDGVIFIQLNPDGSLGELIEPRSLADLALQEALTQALNDPEILASVQGMYQLKKRWEADLPQLEQLTESEKERGRPLPRLLLEAQALFADIRLPEAGMMGPEAALAVAEKVLLALPGWTSEKLSFFSLTLAVYYHSEELERTVYHFVFGLRRPGESEDWDQFEDSYIRPMEALFGGSFETLPQYLSLRLDAATGQAAEAPVIGILSPEYRTALELIR